jgi:hypothetical protein
MQIILLKLQIPHGDLQLQNIFPLRVLDLTKLSLAFILLLDVFVQVVEHLVLDQFVVFDAILYGPDF